MPPHRSTSPDASARASDVAEPGDATPPPPARASSSDSDNGDRAAAVVDTLKALGCDVSEAMKRMRYARAVELSERAVATGVATLPPSATLVLAALRRRVISARCMAAGCAGGITPGSAEFQLASFGAWAGTDPDVRLMMHSQQCSELLHARCRAGTLWTLTHEEQLYFGASGRLMVADMLFEAIGEALTFWPSPRTPAGLRLLARDCGAAIRAVLQLDAAGQLIDERQHGFGIAVLLITSNTGRAIAEVLDLLLSGDALVPLSLLRSECRLTNEEEEAMKSLAARQGGGLALAQRMLPSIEERAAQLQQHARVDLARHGLSSCALPSCAATEPHPKAFKVCARCRSCAYCGVEHQRADWGRHKREDGCQPAQ